MKKATSDLYLELMARALPGRPIGERIRVIIALALAGKEALRDGEPNGVARAEAAITAVALSLEMLGAEVEHTGPGMGGAHG